MTDYSDGPDAESPSLSQDKAILMIRIIWGALLLGECLFMAVVMCVILPNHPKPEHPQPILAWVSLGMMVAILPVTFAIRARVFRRGRESGTLAISALTTGNIIFWAGCEAVTFFGLVAAILNGSIGPTILNVVFAMALQVITFPRAEIASDAA